MSISMGQVGRTYRRDKMSANYMRKRWFDSPETQSAVVNILQAVKKGGRVEARSSPFASLENGLADFRGIDFSGLKIEKVNFDKIDLSFSSFKDSWLRGNSFDNVKFEKADFSEVSEGASIFNSAEFLQCSFNRAVVGYDGSRYDNVLFDSSSFRKTGFIRGEFTNCVFSSCKLKGSDFFASSFEDCTFEGILEDVWFRGGYDVSYADEEFGIAKKNQMKNVSFENAVLYGVHFSNDCDLSTIRLPKAKGYHLFDNWYKRLLHLSETIIEWPSEQNHEAGIFARSHLVQAKNQNWYVINASELDEEAGEETAGKILAVLNEV